MSDPIEKRGTDMPKADFITALVLLVLSAGIIFMSIQMPRLEHRDINPWTIPGIVPAVVGAVIGLMSLALLGRSIRFKGFKLGLTKERIREAYHNDVIRRAAATTLFCLFYGLVMVGPVPYPIATFIFVFLFIVAFEYERGTPLLEQRKMILKAFIEGVLVSGAVSALFYYVFLVRLP